MRIVIDLQCAQGASRSRGIGRYSLSLALESGWTADFLKACFKRAGLTVRIVDHAESDVGFTVIGSHTPIGKIEAVEIGQLWDHNGWQSEPGYMVCLGESNLSIAAPASSRRIIMGLINFRGKPVHMKLSNAQGIIVERDLPVGRSEIELNSEMIKHVLNFSAEKWIPDLEMSNGDKREINMHLQDVTFL